MAKSEPHTKPETEETSKLSLERAESERENA